MWGTEDVLNFYGTFLSFIGTVSLGAIALWQNKKANELCLTSIHLMKDFFIFFDNGSQIQIIQIKPALAFYRESAS